MFHSRSHSLTRTVLIGGLLSLTVTVVDTQAASAVVTAQQAQPEQAQPAQAQPAQAQPEAQPAQLQPTPDSEMAAKIRKAIADDKALAAYAPTLKIVVSDGLVSLKGSVKTEADKKAIGDKADAIAGEKNVMNNLILAADENAAKP